MRFPALDYKADLRMKGRLFYVVFLFVWIPAIATAQTAQIEQWKQSGAYELALQTLVKEQPSAQADYAEWERWERQRYTLYQALGRWSDILERQNSLPSNVSGAFRQWSEVQAVHAYLALRKTTPALTLAQRRIWAEGDLQTLQLWRALLVQMYAAGQDEEAVSIAWRRLKQDDLQNQARGDAGAGQTATMAREEYANAQRTYARSLIQQERYADAVRELSNEGSIDGRLLFAASQLLVNAETAPQVFSLSRQIAETDGATPMQRRRAYVLMARSAGRQKNYEQRARSLVEALAIKAGQTEQDILFRVNADDLWAAYEAWGNSIGVSEGLSSGYENQWLTAMRKPRVANEKAALASVLVLNGRSAQNREHAANILLEALPQLHRGAEQSLWLLNESERLRGSYVNLPDDLQRASLRSALRVANLEMIHEIRQIRGPVADPVADQANGVLDVHAQLLLGESVPAIRFLTDGIDNLSAWFRSSQMDMLVLFRDLQAGGYDAAVAIAGRKLTETSSEQDIRQKAGVFAVRSMIEIGEYTDAAKLALALLSESADAEVNDLPLLAYEALWRAGLTEDARQLGQRKFTTPQMQGRVADLQRRLQVPPLK